MRLKRIIVKKQNTIIALAIFLLAVLILYLQFFHLSYDVKETTIDFTVGDYYGIVVDSDALHFGTVEKGVPISLNRAITITNNYPKVRTALLSVKGNVKDMIVLEKSKVVLDPHQNETLQVTLVYDGKLDYGLYEGVLKVKFVGGK